MKKYIYLTICLMAAVLLLGSPATSMAEKTDTTGKSKKKSPVEMLNAKVNLTEDQKPQVAAIYKEGKAAMTAIKADASLDAEAKKAAIKELKAANKEKINTLLTPEQQAKAKAKKPKVKKDDTE